MSLLLTTELERILDISAKEEHPVAPATLAQIAEQIGEAFRVKPDEVAVLAVTGKGKFLKFLIPEKLQNVGTIPISSTGALASRTAREKKPELINNFTAARHATVFEGVPMGRGQGESIHKIMSAPIVAEGKVLGVVQVSRKGHSAMEAGPDFSQTDLKDLLALSGVLARFIALCKVE